MTDLGPLPRASATDTIRIGVNVLVPLAGRGVVLRRPRVVGLADRLDADRRAVHLMQRLRSRYGPGPLQVLLPGRRVALVLDPEDVTRVLAESPEPFAVPSRDRRGALTHFQPHGVLVSNGAERAERRRLNERVLNSAQPTHELADAFAAKIREEAVSLVAELPKPTELAWDQFARTWWHIVRRIVLGDAARYDDETTDPLRKLRSAANWSYLRPTRRALRERLARQLCEHLDRAEPGSLACLLKQAVPDFSGRAEPVDQLQQWLFAFEAAGMAALRTLALLAAHPAELERARGEPGYLRACVLESVRLWPTTPVILRDNTTETAWRGRSLPAGAAVAIFAPFFHRDDRRLPYADRFSPRIWLDGRVQHSGSLVPFSAGPGECAGRNLVLFTASTLLAALTEEHDVRLVSPPSLLRRGRLPGTLSPFRLRFELVPLAEEHSDAVPRAESSRSPS